jgi:glutathione S-transferase
MKLIYSPGACSLGIHVILEEIGQPFETQRVSTRDGSVHKPEFIAINPKSKVPTLIRDDGSVLTEFQTMAFWLARAHPAAALIPDDLEGQARTLEMLDYICGTIHPQGFTRQFRPANFARDEDDQPRVIAQGKAMAEKYLALLADNWRGGEWLLPTGYSVADAALFFIENWCARAGIMPPDRIAAHHQAMLSRPAVQRALATEAA